MHAEQRNPGGVANRATRAWSLRRRRPAAARAPAGPRRRGAALLIAMVCVGLVSAVAASLLRCAVVQVRQSRVQQLQGQAVWLVESGANRAAALLAVDPEYKGETWKPMPLGFAPESMNATVTITVRTVEGKPNWRTVEVQAVHPVDRKLRARVRKTFQIRLPKKAGDKS